MIKLLIIHGEKPTRSGSIHPAFLSRLSTAVKLCHNNSYNLVVITGGQTRKNAPTEAAQGLEYLRSKINLPIILEEKARSTAENIIFTKKLLKGGKIASATIVTSQKRFWRTGYLYSRLWPELRGKTEIIGSPDPYPVFFLLREWLLFLFAVLNSKEKFCFLAKKFFRNG